RLRERGRRAGRRRALPRPARALRRAPREPAPLPRAARRARRSERDRGGLRAAHRGGRAVERAACRGRPGRARPRSGALHREPRPRRRPRRRGAGGDGARRERARVNALALRWRAWRIAAPGATSWTALLAVALLAAAAIALRVGAVEVSFLDLARAAGRDDVSLAPALREVRLPRIACGAAVGAALAVAGAVLQTALRNPLADAGIVGVTAGAGLAALVGILFFPHLPALVPPLAFAGGIAAVSLVMGLGFRHGGLRSGPLRLVLSGVAVQAVGFAGVALLSFLYADRAPSFTAFLVGSLNGKGWNEARLVAVPALLGLAAAALATRPLDVLLLDDATAGGLGVAVRRARFLAAALAAWLAA